MAAVETRSVSMGERQRVGESTPWAQLVEAAAVSDKRPVPKSINASPTPSVLAAAASSVAEAAIDDDMSNSSESEAPAPAAACVPKAAVRGKIAMRMPPVYGKKCRPYGKKAAAMRLSTSDDEDTTSSSDEEEDSNSPAPPVRAVLAGPARKEVVAAAAVATSKPARSSSPAGPAAAAAASKQAAQTSAKHGKTPPAPHLRRLRLSAPQPKKRPAAEPKPRGQPSEKRAKGGEPEPQEVQDSDDKSLDTHPIVVYLRSHTPVKPCGRCAKCKKPPCGKCESCKKNVHLTERSRARERCTANGCTKLTEEELDRYRRAFSSGVVDALEKELRNIGEEFTALQERRARVPAAEMATLREKQANLIGRLQALNEEDPYVIQQTPDGYDCFMLSIQTMETERDRIARLVKRRACRDPPKIMNSRRLLRDFYGVKICAMARTFATEMVALPYVQKLIEIADEHERVIEAFPRSDP